jgi:hypothetical protein
MRRALRALFPAFAVVALAVGAAPKAGADDIVTILFGPIFDELVAFDPVVAELAPDPPPGPGQDFAVGSQKVTEADGDLQHVRVAAHSGPAGQDPRGQVRVTSTETGLFGGPFEVQGSVTCLSVTGNTARVAALLTQPHMGFSHVTLLIQDVGNPGAPNMGMSPDLAFISFASAPVPSTCSGGGATLFGETTGNFVVNDAS